MNKIHVDLPEIKLLGITARTNNMNEMNPMSAKILPTLQRYFQQGVAAMLPNRKRIGVTYCVYTQYESDFRGDYTYFVGEEVTSFENAPQALEQLVIPAQTYAKFTNGPGVMPAVCIAVWQKIWQEPHILEGKRRYLADFEIYDERALNPAATVLDVYVGIS